MQGPPLRDGREVHCYSCFLLSTGSINHIDASTLRYNDSMQLNQPAPDFELPDLQRVLHKLSDYRDKIVILNFWSAECPHSERTDHYLSGILERWYREIVLLSIASNRNESVRTLEEAAKARRIPQVLVDREELAADIYEAVTTPHVFVVDRDGILRYRGAVDNVSFRQREATRFFLEEVVEALLEDRLPELSETPAYGCAIVREF